MAKMWPLTDVLIILPPKEKDGNDDLLPLDDALSSFDKKGKVLPDPFDHRASAHLFFCILKPAGSVKDGVLDT